jgi:hypothetical protein
MGLGWHVALERELPVESAAPTDGKSLIFYQRELEAAAQQLGLAPLQQFVSAIPEKVRDYLAQQGLNAEQFPLADEEWFSAADGLQTVRGLLAHLQSAPRTVTDPTRVVRDLQRIERILDIAERAQVRFHLVSDLPGQ